MVDERRLTVLALAAGLLVALLLAVTSMAKYEALRTSIHNACPSAAALDLTAWIPLCKSVGFQEFIMPEDLERP